MRVNFVIKSKKTPSHIPPMASSAATPGGGANPQAGGAAQFQEVLPRQGQLYQEDLPTTVLCKPKLMPLKSVTLERLERMQREAQETVREQEKAAQQAGPGDPFGLPQGGIGGNESQSQAF